MSESHLSAIPNAFYDFIVFVTPSVLLAAGVATGAAGVEWVENVNLADVAALNLIGGVAIAVVLSYEYGRIAESWSAMVVQRPLKWANGRFSWFGDGDFCRLPPEIYEYLDLRAPYDGRDGDKWVIYLFAFLVSPALGGDLLKRYAWEKLARSAAFTYAILAAASLTVGAASILRRPYAPRGRDRLRRRVWYTLVVVGLTAVTYGEYLKRNVWNYDLLTRTAPILLEARRLAASGDRCASMSGTAQTVAEYIYLEQRVNGGSPSGFSAKHRPNAAFDPALAHSFEMPLVRVPARWLIGFGEMPQSLSLKPDEIAAHPQDAWLCRRGTATRSIACFPTASGRTVVVGDSDVVGVPWHLKLSYPGVLGRVRREMPWLKAAAGVETSAQLENGSWCDHAGFMREVACRGIVVPEGSRCFVVRDHRPFPPRERAHGLVPWFLADRRRPGGAGGDRRCVPGRR